MTEAINLFQSLFTFRSLFTFEGFPTADVSKEESKLALLLKCEARQMAAQAVEEMRNGQAAQSLVVETAGKNKTLAKIAVWHSRRAAEKYRRAAEKFVEAGKIKICKQKAFGLKAKEMTERAAQAEAAIEILSDFLKQN